jgi:hypothetical protein
MLLLLLLPLWLLSTSSCTASPVLRAPLPPLLLLANTSLPTPISLTTSNGQRVRCFLTAADPSQAAPSPASETPPAYHEPTLDAVLATLKDSCVSEPASVQWWRVTWCFGKEVRQVHSEGAQEVVAYSLGGFHSSTVLSAGSAESAALFYQEEFTKGQYCEESKAARRTVARLFCCPDAEDVEFLWFLEARLCSYVVAMCSSRVCLAGLPLLSAASPRMALLSLADLCVSHAGQPPPPPPLLLPPLPPPLADRAKSGSKQKETLLVCLGRKVETELAGGAVTPLGVFDASGEAIAWLVRETEEDAHSSWGELHAVQDEPALRRQGAATFLQAYIGGTPCADAGGRLSATLVRAACFSTKSRAPYVLLFRRATACASVVHLHVPALCQDRTWPGGGGGSSSSHPQQQYKLECVS